MTVITLTRTPSGGFTATAPAGDLWTTPSSRHEVVRHLLFYPAWTRKGAVPPPKYMGYATWGGLIWTRTPENIDDTAILSSIISTACSHADRILRAPEPTLEQMCQALMGAQPPLGRQSPAGNLHHGWYTPARVEAVRNFRPHPYLTPGANRVVSQFADVVLEATMWGMVETEKLAKAEGVTPQELGDFYYRLTVALGAVVTAHDSVEISLIGLRKATLRSADRVLEVCA